MAHDLDLGVKEVTVKELKRLAKIAYEWRLDVEASRKSMSKKLISKKIVEYFDFYDFENQNDLVRFYDHVIKILQQRNFILINQVRDEAEEVLEIMGDTMFVGTDFKVFKIEYESLKKEK